MPFMFVYTDILMPDGLNAQVLWTWAVLFASTVPFAAGLMGFLFTELNNVKRVALVVSSVLLLFPSVLATTDGVVICLAIRSEERRVGQEGVGRCRSRWQQ